MHRASQIDLQIVGMNLRDKSKIKYYIYIFIYLVACIIWCTQNSINCGATNLRVRFIGTHFCFIRKFPISI